jgi:hypothetical protein
VSDELRFEFPAEAMGERAPGDTQRLGAVQIAHCPEHGLHGSRGLCFECRRPVQQVWFVTAVDAQLTPETVVCLDCGTWAGPSCSDILGHGVATLAELMDAYSNPS